METDGVRIGVDIAKSKEQAKNQRILEYKRAQQQNTPPKR
jgi:hypothetical protein